MVGRSSLRLGRRWHGFLHCSNRSRRRIRRYRPRRLVQYHDLKQPELARLPDELDIEAARRFFCLGLSNRPLEKNGYHIRLRSTYQCDPDKPEFICDPLARE